jgi:hypothetical protein
MEDLLNKHLKDIYGLNPDMPHLALQFPRLPPGLLGSKFNYLENPMKTKFVQDNATINKKLEGFQQSYQKYVSGLLNMGSSVIIPPGHPLFNQHISVNTLKAENDKLLKENLELRKKLDKESQQNEHRL